MNQLLSSPRPIQGLSSPDPSKMKLSVESAHTYLRKQYVLEKICDNIKSHAHELTFDARLAINAAESLMNSLKSKQVMIPYGHHISIAGVDCTDEDKEIIAVCLNFGSRIDDVKHSVSLTVDPSVTVGALKSALQPNPWIPRDNLVLVKQHDNTPLDDDSATLVQCGVKDSDTLLACQGGSFTVTVHEFISQYNVPVSSCFETIHNVKEKIHLITGYPPECQILYHGRKELSDDATTLVSLGIVRPYTSRMLARLSILIPDKMEPGVRYC